MNRVTKHIQPTSREANEASKPKRPTNHMKILQALEKLPNNEGIADRIAAYCSLDKIEVSRRMKELLKAGKVINTGRTGVTAKGCLLSCGVLPKTKLKKLNKLYSKHFVNPITLCIFATQLPTQLFKTFISLAGLIAVGLDTPQGIF